MFLHCCSSVLSVYHRMRNALDGQSVLIVKTRMHTISCLLYFACDLYTECSFIKTWKMVLFSMI